MHNYPKNGYTPLYASLKIKFRVFAAYVFGDHFTRLPYLPFA